MFAPYFAKFFFQTSERSLDFTQQCTLSFVPPKYMAAKFDRQASAALGLSGCLTYSKRASIDRCRIYERRHFVLCHSLSIAFAAQARAQSTLEKLVIANPCRSIASIDPGF